MSRQSDDQGDYVNDIASESAGQAEQASEQGSGENDLEDMSDGEMDRLYKLQLMKEQQK